MRVPLTPEQEKSLEEITDEQLERECADRGIWNHFTEDDCEECEECACEGFEADCEAIRQAFLVGNVAKAIDLSRQMVSDVTGRFL